MYFNQILARLVAKKTRQPPPFSQRNSFDIDPTHSRHITLEHCVENF
jgi:hypothetical protein